MELSVIIVNYNVKFFLEQCLCSLWKAIDQYADNSTEAIAEVIVIDNHSTDGSLSYLQPRFPRVRFISNGENIGFARANNQALKLSMGQHILFLNPDTILAEDTLKKCIAFLLARPQAGAIGVRMIDGSGAFLRESKRGFPFPSTAFYKLSGLSAVFPSSKRFAAYYLGDLPPFETNAVDALSGAFMMVKKEVLDKTGGFDEQFFMYAEDIDLSYRIQLAGYLNYYFPDTCIIHFKGESTKKDSKYVKLFYKAMNQFMRKYFSGNRSRVLITMMDIGIWLQSRVSAATKALPRRNEKVKTNRIKTFLKGDQSSLAALQSNPSLSNRVFVENQHEATEIILCEGPRFSFQQIIETLQQKKSDQSYRIHALASQSIVGSDSKDRPGEAIVW